MNKSDTAPRLGGWLLVPLAWLIMTMLTSAMLLAMYLSPRFNLEWRSTLFSHHVMLVTNWAVSLLTTLAVWLYSLWVCWILCKRSRRLPRQYINLAAAGAENLRLYPGF